MGPPFAILTSGIALAIFAASLIQFHFWEPCLFPLLTKGQSWFRCIVCLAFLSQNLCTVIRSSRLCCGSFLKYQGSRALTGSPEIATDPMAIDQSDVYVTLRPADEWPKKRSKDDLIRAMKKRLKQQALLVYTSF